MKLPSFLDFAFLLSAIPYPTSERAVTSEVTHEDFTLTLLAATPEGLPSKPLGYLVLVYIANEALGREAREIGSGLGALCRSLGAHELADDPRLVEDQLLRLSETFVRIDIAGKKAARTILFPLFSQLILETSEGSPKRHWHVRLSGDFYRLLKQTAPARISAAQDLPASS
jgi:hypothetical protein